MAENLRADVLVIGWGKAGKTIAGALGGQGRRVVMVEQAEPRRRSSSTPARRPRSLTCPAPRTIR